MGEQDPSIEFEVEKIVYPDTQDTDEQRRAFVFEHLASADIDGQVLIENMQMVCDWLETSKLPAKAPSKRKLEVVKA